MHRLRQPRTLLHRSALLLFACCRLLSAQTAAQPSVATREADTAFRAGYAAIAANDMQQARAQFGKVVRLAPAIEEGHSALGAVLFQLRDYPHAIAELTTAVRLKPDDHAASTNLAMAYAATGAYAKAVPLFASLQKGGDALPADVLRSYAVCLTALNRTDEAIATTQQAISAAPDNAALHDMLGSLYAQQSRWPDAQQEFAAALRIDPQLAAAHMHLGVVLINQQQQPAEAIAQLKAAAQLAPADANTLQTVGKTLVSANDDEDAVPVLEAALRLNHDPSTQYQLALAYQGVGRSSDALPLFDAASKAHPQDPDILTNRALALVQVGRAKEAIPLFQRALATTQQTASVHEDLGVAYLQQSDVDDALREFKAGLQQSPSDPQLHYNLGLAYKLKDDVSAALPELESAARLDPSAPDPPFTLGILYMQQGRFDDAAQQLHRALDLRPDNGEGWALLGSVLKQQNKLPEAAEALQHAIKLLPNQPGPHITLASVLTEQGDKAGAAAERKTAADLTRVAVDRQRATFATNTGNMLLQKGEVADAVARYQEAVSSDPSYADAHRQLAAAFERQGRTSDAQAERKKAAELETKQP